MEIARSLTELSEGLSALVEQRDLSGAEEFLSQALGLCRQSSRNGPSSFEAYIHFQFGRLYREWNKLSSAINHLNLAVELTIASGADSLFLMQVLEELNQARKGQSKQKP